MCKVVNVPAWYGTRLPQKLADTPTDAPVLSCFRNTEAVVLKSVRFPFFAKGVP